MNRWNMDRDVLEFCAAIAMLLAWAKLDDDVRDGVSWPRQAFYRSLRTPIARAHDYLDQRRPGLLLELKSQIARHVALERAPHTTASLRDYVTPTAEAFGTVWEAFGELIAAKGGTEMPFRDLGYQLGAAIVAYDCAVDYPRDRQLGQYNPLTRADDRRKAIRQAQGDLVAAGWACCTAWGDACLSADVLAGRIQSMSDRLHRLRSCTVAPAGAQRGPEFWRSAIRDLACWTTPFRSSRRGDCDCGGCDGCGDVGGCDGCAGGGGGGLDAADASCNCCLGCGDTCCWWDWPCDRKQPGQGHGKQAGNSGSVANSSRSVVGQRGVAVSDLTPTGMVLLDGRETPAKAESAAIRTGTTVEVVQRAAFGLVVRPAPADVHREAPGD